MRIINTQELNFVRSISRSHLIQIRQNMKLRKVHFVQIGIKGEGVQSNYLLHKDGQKLAIRGCNHKADSVTDDYDQKISLAALPLTN